MNRPAREVSASGDVRETARSPRSRRVQRHAGPVQRTLTQAHGVRTRKLLEPGRTEGPGSWSPGHGPRVMAIVSRPCFDLVRFGIIVVVAAEINLATDPSSNRRGLSAMAGAADQRPLGISRSRRGRGKGGGGPGRVREHVPGDRDADRDLHQPAARIARPPGDRTQARRNGRVATIIRRPGLTRHSPAHGASRWGNRG